MIAVVYAESAQDQIRQRQLLLRALGFQSGLRGAGVHRLIAVGANQKDSPMSAQSRKMGIRIRKVWFDDDLVELQIDVSDGRSSFSNRTYVGHGQLAEAVSQLDAFRPQTFGGIVDVKFGAFGPEFASGAFHGRFHFQKAGRLFITSQQESEYHDFGTKNVASRAVMYLRSEPALLDRFVVELKGLSTGSQEDASLEGV